MRDLARRILRLVLPPALAPVLALAGLATAVAQTALPGDPPARVGRLSHVEGQVSLRTPDQAEWSAAPLNYPVSTGLSLWTEPEARAEISYGEGALRLDHETALAVDRLDDAAVDLRLDQGSVQLSLRQLGPRERVSIATPQGRMDALAPGTYRIDAGTGETPAGVTVLDGKARFGDGERSVEVVGGESAIARPDGSLAAVAAIRRPFDDWALAREAEVKAATVTPRHVPPSMPGHEDLERHGTWEETPEYGAVWYPTAVPVGWAPYHYGHWAWVAPWGWTWIDDAPWGFAPFHYGRWAHHHGRWGWVPGRYARYRPVYAPALVAFIGGSNFSIGVSIGRAPAIGWVPLGPREVYYPHYRSSVTYVRNINVVHVHRTVINNINVTRIKHGPSQRHADGFANRRAATVVPVDAMRRAEPVHRAAPKREFSSAELRDARPTANLAAVQQPSRAARAGFETQQAATARGPDRRDEGPALRQPGPGRPVTSDPDRLPPAPAPRREARATPDRGPQDRPGPDRAGLDRAGPDRAGPDRTGIDRRDRGAPAPQLISPSAGPTAPQMREATPRQMQSRDLSVREAQESGSSAPQPPARERVTPTSRSEAAGRPAMPTMHGPGYDQGVRRDQGPPRGAPVARTEPPRMAPPDASNRQRTEQPAIQAPRATRIEPSRTPQPRAEQPRAERPRSESPRPEVSRPESSRPESSRQESPRRESPRFENPRMDQPRMERRSAAPRVEPQRVERPRAVAQPEQRQAEQRQAERRESPRQACTPGADCTR